MPLTLQQFREQNPAYSDTELWSDQKLADGLYNKFYAKKMDRAAFDQAIGYNQVVTAAPAPEPAPSDNAAIGAMMQAEKAKTGVVEPQASLPNLAPQRNAFTLPGEHTGMTARGNIDLYTRPKVKNPNGSISTVRSMSFNEDGKEILVPTVSDDGRILSDKEAIDQYHKTGKYLGKFDTPENANKYAETLHQQQDQLYNKSSYTVGEALQNSAQTFMDRMKMRVSSAMVGLTEQALKDETAFPPGSEKRKLLEQKVQGGTGQYTEAYENLKKDTLKFNDQPIVQAINDIAVATEDMGPSILGGLALAPTMGATAVTLTLMGTQAFGDSYMQRKAAGETSDQAFQGALFTAGVESLTELIPMQVFFKAGKPALRKVLEMTLGEGGQEAVSSLLESLYDKNTIQPDMTLSQALRAAGYEGVIGAGAGGVMGGVAVGVEKAVTPSKQAQAGAALQALVDSAEVRPEAAEKIALGQMAPPQPGEMAPTGHKQGERVGPPKPVETPEESVEANKVWAAEAKAAVGDEPAAWSPAWLKEHGMWESGGKIYERGPDGQARQVLISPPVVQETTSGPGDEGSGGGGTPVTPAAASEAALATLLEKSIQQPLIEPGEENQQQATEQPDVKLPVNDRGLVPVYHYSRVTDLTTLDPGKYGTGIAGAEMRRKLNNPKTWQDRTYFYVGDQHTREVSLGPQQYRAELEPEQLYDLYHDPEGFMQRAKEEYGAPNPTLAEKLIKDAGYLGYWTEHPSLGYTVATFRPVQVTQTLNGARLNRQINNEGGFTVDPATGQVPTEGYAVGVGREQKYEGDVSAKEIEAYVQKNADLLYKPGYYLGGWKDGNTVYLDVSKVHPNTAEGKAQAIRDGEARGEIAIWDFGKSEEVRLKKAGPPIEPDDADQSEKPEASDIIDITTGESLSAARMRDAVQNFGPSSLVKLVFPSQRETHTPSHLAGPVAEQILAASSKADLIDRMKTLFVENRMSSQLSAEQAAKMLENGGQRAIDDLSAYYKNNADAMADMIKDLTAEPKKAEPLVDEPNAIDRAVTKTPKFKRWFGESKVVDDKGEPLVVYHGTNKDFNKFSIRKTMEDHTPMLFFSGQTETAGDFALYRRTYPGANIMPVFLKMKKPLIIAGRGGNIREVESFAEKQFVDINYGETIRDYAKRKKYDGVIFENVVDDVVSSPTIPRAGNVYAVFSPKQIKSAIGNRGTFESDNPNINEAPGWDKVEPGKSRIQKQAEAWFAGPAEELPLPPYTAGIAPLVQVVTSPPTRAYDLQAYTANNDIGYKLVIPRGDAAISLQTALSELFRLGLPQPSVYSIHAFMGVKGRSAGQQAIIDPNAGDGSYVALDLDDLYAVRQHLGQDAITTTAPLFVLAHEIGHSIDYGHIAPGARKITSSELSPHFDFRWMDNGNIRLDGVLQELYEAYQGNTLGLRAILQYPFAQVAQPNSLRTKFGSLPKHEGKAAAFVQKEAFAQLFAIHYVLGATRAGYEKLKAALPRSMALMDEVHNALSQAQSLEERDAAVRSAFRLAASVSVPGRTGRGPASPAGAPVEQARSGVDEIRAGELRFAAQPEQPAAGGTELLSEPQALPVYHGSPHMFDKFSMSKIGTGEGVQAYGHGLYFAESLGVAKSYQNAFRGKAMVSAFDDSAEYRAAMAVQAVGEKQAIINFENNMKNFSAGEAPYEKSKAALAAVESGAYKRVQVPSASLYEVDIPDEAISKMLDYDKPLSSQPYVQNALREAIPRLGMGPKTTNNILNKKTKMTGKELYRALQGVVPRTEKQGFEQAVSEYLKSLGIPGIRYLDASSRTAGEGTRNIVLFDDSLAKIISRNGEPIIQLLEPNDINQMPAINVQQARDTTRRWVRRNFTKEGLRDKATFEAGLKSDAQKNVGELDNAFFIRDLERAAMSAYGVPYYMKLSPQQLDAMHRYLVGEPATVPPGVKPALDAMRAYTDRLSNDMLRAIREMLQIENDNMTPAQQQAFVQFLQTGEGEPPAPVAKHFYMYQTVGSNIGTYLNRSYQAFDDPEWMDKVLQDDTIISDAEAFVAQQNPQLTPDEVTGAVRSILRDAQETQGFQGLISKGTKQGSKDVSFLKRRKDVPVEIRRLLGEYRDPRLNFARTATKMQWYLANHDFLMKVRQHGLGVFLFPRPTGIFDTRIAPENAEQLNPLDGLYTSKDFVDGLRDADGRYTGGEVMRTLIRLNSTIKYGKTILAPTTQLRNFYSAAMFTVMNGHFNWSHIPTAWSAGTADLFTNNRAWHAYLKKLVGLGVLHDNPYAGELRDVLNEFMSMDLYRQGPFRQTKQLLDFAQRAYRFGDDFWKIVGYENEVARQLHSGKTQAQAEEVAAKRIRDGYPTYSMVPRGVRFLRRAPIVGSFVSFPYEIMRTSYNQFRFLAEDAADGNMAAVVARTIGMVVAGAAAYALSEWTMRLMGMTDDDDEAVRAMLPPWSRNSQLAYTGFDENGLPTYLDLSYLDPYTYIKKPLSALLNDNNLNWKEKGMDALRELSEPFIGADIGAGAIFEMLKRGQEMNRKGVYDIPYLLQPAKQVLPGFVSNLERTYLALEGDSTSTGKQFTLHDEGWAWLGFRFGTLNMRQSMIYKGRDFATEKRAASDLLSYTAGSASKVSDAKLKSRVEAMLDTRSRAFTTIIKAVNNAEKLGMSRGEIIRSLKNGGVSQADIGYILRGAIPRWTMSSQFIERARERAELSAPSEARRLELRAELQRRKSLIRQFAAEAQRDVQ